MSSLRTLQHSSTLTLNLVCRLNILAQTWANWDRYEDVPQTASQLKQIGRKQSLLLLLLLLSQ